MTINQHLENNKYSSFQNIILRLQQYWSKKGCTILQPYDIEIGSATLHPYTSLLSLGKDKWNVAYVQPSRRPGDGRYGENPNRLQSYYQFQVIMKPSPYQSQDMYIDSLKYLGIDPMNHDIRFIEDNWESPTLGAWGLGWEVWLDGMEITQFTYFQQLGGIDCFPIPIEIAYGLERLAMFIQGIENIYEIDYDGNGTTYGDLFLQREKEQCTYNFEFVSTDMLFRHFNDMESECKKNISNKLAFPAYECALKASHIFNLLDARNVISVKERASYIARVRNLSNSCCKLWLLKQKNHVKEI